MLTIFTSNISFKVSESELKKAFEDFGVVNSCKIVYDKDTKKSKGYGFVEMEEPEALKAIKGLNGVLLGGRELAVKVSDRNYRAEHKSKGRHYLKRSKSFRA